MKTKKQATREALQRAARRLLAEHGAEKMSTAMVAASAGLSVGSIYLHFKTKEDLIASLFEHACARMLLELDGCSSAADAWRATEAFASAEAFPDFVWPAALFACPGFEKKLSLETLSSAWIARERVLERLSDIAGGVGPGAVLWHAIVGRARDDGMSSAMAGIAGCLSPAVDQIASFWHAWERARSAR